MITGDGPIRCKDSGTDLDEAEHVTSSTFPQKQLSRGSFYDRGERASVGTNGEALMGFWSVRDGYRSRFDEPRSLDWLAVKGRYWCRKRGGTSAVGRTPGK